MEKSVYDKHEKNKNKPGFYPVAGTDAYIYHFGATIPANKAKLSDFPRIEREETDKVFGIASCIVIWCTFDDPFCCS